MGAERIDPARSLPRTVLRVVAAAAASAGLLLHLLNLALLAWSWSAGGPETVAVEVAGGAVPRVIRSLAWGVGFSVLSLVIVWRVGDRYEALIAALFLGFYSLWGGIGDATPLRDASWWWGAMLLLDALTHAMGVRFTQLFPRPLRREDLLSLGPAWLRRTAMPVLATLLDARVFWSAAVVIEGGLRLLPEGPGLVGAHILLWVVLAATYLYASYRRGDADARQRIFWIMEGVLVFVAAQIVFMAFWAIERVGVASVDLDLWASWLWAVTSWLTLACFYLAVFYYGALDSALILRRTTVLSASSAAAVLIFLTLESLTEQLLSDLVGVESRIGDIVGGVVAGLTFHPLSVRIDRGVQRWLDTPESNGVAADVVGEE